MCIWYERKNTKPKGKENERQQKQIHVKTNKHKYGNIQHKFEKKNSENKKQNIRLLDNNKEHNENIVKFSEK